MDAAITQCDSSPGPRARVHMSDVSVTIISIISATRSTSGEGGMVLPTGYSKILSQTPILVWNHYIIIIIIIIIIIKLA